MHALLMLSLSLASPASAIELDVEALAEATFVAAVEVEAARTRLAMREQELSLAIDHRTNDKLRVKVASAEVKAATEADELKARQELEEVREKLDAADARVEQGVRAVRVARLRLKLESKTARAAELRLEHRTVEVEDAYSAAPILWRLQHAEHRVEVA